MAGPCVTDGRRDRPARRHRHRVGRRECRPVAMEIRCASCLPSTGRHRPTPPAGWSTRWRGPPPPSSASSASCRRSRLASPPSACRSPSPRRAIRSPSSGQPCTRPPSPSSDPGAGSSGSSMTGRPASAIVDEAAAWGAELIVVGSRGLGRLGTMVLGSVSAEVVDHAPCPVLVTRSAAIRSILVAVDGSASARQAVTHLALGYLRGPAGRGARGGPDASERCPGRCHRRTGGRGAGGRWLPRPMVRQPGRPCPRDHRGRGALDADLIVLGSRGLTGLARLRLGSVARNVLLHTPSSVLIVRGPSASGTPSATRTANASRPPAPLTPARHRRPGPFGPGPGSERPPAIGPFGTGQDALPGPTVASAS